MPYKPDTPCASCGRLLWSSSTSLPAGKRTCLDCRRAAVKPKFKPELRACGRCRHVFEATRSSQKYCPPCRGKSSRFGKRRTARPSADRRGYGAAHKRERAKWKPIVDAGKATCALCKDPIEPGSTWHLDHTPDRTAYRGPAHATCNIRDGAKRGRAQQNARETTLRW